MASAWNRIDWTDYADTPAALEQARVESGEPWTTCRVASLQYHSWHEDDGVGGRVLPKLGDRLALVREPGNRYDRHAIQVIHRNQHQVGHLPRELAAELAHCWTGASGCAPT
jgi:hypothetical protein